MTCLSETLAFLVLFFCQTDIGSKKDGALIMICPGQDFKRPRFSTLRIGTDGFAAAVRELCLSPSANRKGYPGNPITPFGARKCPDYAQIHGSPDHERWTGGRLRPPPPKMADVAPVSGPASRPAEGNLVETTIEIDSNVSISCHNRPLGIYCVKIRIMRKYRDVARTRVLCLVLFSCEAQESDPPLQLVGD
ncbi:hypothetical protein CABS01_14946 [Colletotrichum abscissum]|uniref:uncharacterized protein n=1 Tax=Colletotrichum abscissum TaxID=1671311 RepID=UPI0027D6BAC4|nr:uncharacterized protein CABS01_14946 [Colletotrichum abscissum]KAK1477479.1 hypothetical protein CABS01_14946 [Colletotrichum abscissum]